MNRDSILFADRRAFLAGCARAAVLSGIAVAAGVLVGRRQIGGCPYGTFACAACGRAAYCALPAAVAARRRPARQEMR